MLFCMSKHLQCTIVLLFMVILATAQTAIADSVTVELAEKTPPADSGDPTMALTPIPACVPIDCGGYYACSCQVCCPSGPQPCFQTESSDVVQAILGWGCTLAPGNSCNNCPTPAPTGNGQSCVWVSVWGYNLDEFFSNVQLPMGSDQAAVPGCFVSKWDPDCSFRFELYGSDVPDSLEIFGDCSDAVADLGTFLGDPEMTQGTGYTTEPNGEMRGAYWYMDANCQWTSPGANTEICGLAGVCVSPISLLWDENASLTTA